MDVAGFGADRLGIVWVGYDDNRPTGLTGSSGALRVWSSVMQELGIVGLNSALPVRTRRWRYILYNNGSEELYDHDADPYEWSNLCADTRLGAVKAELKAQILRMTGR